MKQLSRRFFLKGVTGATIALPVLPSLLTASEARADANDPKKFFVFFRTGHGGVWANNMFPSLGAAPSTMEYAGRTIRKAQLARTVSSGRASLSPVLSASDSLLTSALVSKMNVIRGLDIPFYMAHHTGGNLGDYWRSAADSENNTAAGTIPKTPTVDQLMAWSSSVYPSTPSLRSIVFNGDGTSRFYENASARTGALTAVGDTANSAYALFSQLFPSGTAPLGADTPRLLDRVRDSYLALKNDTRLSREDKNRLEEHLTRVHEIDARLSVDAPTCTAVAPRDDRRDIDQAGYWSKPELMAARWKGLLEVTSLALTCGLTKVAVFRLDETFSSYASSGYHSNVAHRAHLEAPEANTVDAQADEVGSHQRFFEKAMLPFVSSLGSFLDHGQVVWSHECGVLTHSSMSMPLVTFGGLGGAFATGKFVDYRNQSLQVMTSNVLQQHANVVERPGLLWAQWLGHLLRGMGVPRSEWMQPPGTVGGYPHLTFRSLPNYRRQSGKTLDDYYPSDLFARAADNLPWLAAS